MTTSMWRVLTVCLVLAFASSAIAESNDRKEDRRCSNRTLSGDYGTQIEGTILGPNLPLRTISMAHFDGEGNVTSVDHVVVNGMLPAEEWRPGNWTYTVNTDCTGRGSVATGPDTPPINFHFVVVKHGTEFHGVVDGSAITLNGYRVD